MGDASGSAPRRPPLPRGWRRFLFRLPIRLCRARLGALLGQRFLLLEHAGRTSGQVRRVVIEVVAREDPYGPSWTVASGFGPGSAWYRNLRTTPRATIQVGARRREVEARFLSPEEGGESMGRYAVRHPRVARRLCAFMGFEVRDGSPEEFRRVATSIPFVRFEPAGR
ncbi:deazaflavin-dependent oxidoreductase (nitroreductase family) [Streptomyces sp. Amel2xB2]|uniref:nitroreductase family deazaflavin-dependent oxidoreductase n=1 Tax=Streptomyces sp. Amel2xB2 TaxID=1305829 RepID=UPI000DBA9608|nr:nitroreductase family deazaflavin-dependent oxidoreductase [Streptomyces sp. Amel2xB2]RAJ69659.1 deazaflavin-dependent oxidoreductase (nitroreductase family) [Streptomyces sp. Amel2xB2]